MKFDILIVNFLIKATSLKTHYKVNHKCKNIFFCFYKSLKNMFLMFFFNF